MIKVLLVQPRFLKSFYLIYSLVDQDGLPTEPVWNDTPNEAVLHICNNHNKNAAESSFSELKKYKSEN